MIFKKYFFKILFDQKSDGQLKLNRVIFVKTKPVFTIFVIHGPKQGNCLSGGVDCGGGLKNPGL
jgi:hypothetical protein